MSPELAPAAAEPASLDDVVAAIRDLKDLFHALRDCLAPQPLAEVLDRIAFAAMLGIGASTLDRLRETGAIGPRSFPLAGPKWHLAEVRAWLRQRDHAGELHGAKTWPGVWEAIQRKAGVVGR